nr:MAG TPA: nucleotidase 5'-nucleotidase [Bacteriophage sp.]
MGKRKMIYSFDFDGTLCTNKFPQIGEPIQNVVNLARQVKSEGHYIILNTMREGKSLDEAIEWCKNQGIVFDAINDNLPHMKEYFNNNPRKIFANYYIDDHNWFVTSVNEVKKKPRETFVLTSLEYEVLKYFKYEGYKYIARDLFNSTLCFYEGEPKKSIYALSWSVVGGEWYSNKFFDKFFKFIKWEDEEPYLIAHILNDCEVN